MGTYEIIAKRRGYALVEDYRVTTNIKAAVPDIHGERIFLGIYYGFFHYNLRRLVYERIAFFSGRGLFDRFRGCLGFRGEAVSGKEAVISLTVTRLEEESRERAGE